MFVIYTNYSFNPNCRIIIREISIQGGTTCGVPISCVEKNIYLSNNFAHNWITTAQMLLFPTTFTRVPMKTASRIWIMDIWMEDMTKQLEVCILGLVFWLLNFFPKKCGKFPIPSIQDQPLPIPSNSHPFKTGHFPSRLSPENEWEFPNLKFCIFLVIPYFFVVWCGGEGKG